VLLPSESALNCNKDASIEISILPPAGIAFAVVKEIV
jgi:hypothetical protein